MATVTFPIDLPADLESDISIKLLIPVIKETAANHEKIRAQLQAFHEDEDGSPTVADFEVNSDDFIYDAATHKGKVIFRYKVNYSFGCSDVNRDVPLLEKADFEINTLNKTLSIYIHDKMVRDSFEEF